MSGRARSRCCVAIAVLLFAGWLSGCAPRAPLGVPELGPGPRRDRFEAGWAMRARPVAAEAALSAWVRGDALPGLPGVHARLLLGAPDAFRLRVESLFGTAIDVAARGDSLTAYVPSRRVGLETSAAGESLGFGDPGGLGYRLWSATWRPPERVWRDGKWADSLLVVSWIEGLDSLALAVGASGLPRRFEVIRAGAARVRARYPEWTRFAGVAWPSVVEVESGTGAFELVCRVRDVRFAREQDRARLTVVIPDDADHMTRAELMRAIERLGRL